MIFVSRFITISFLLFLLCPAHVLGQSGQETTQEAPKEEEQKVDSSWVEKLSGPANQTPTPTPAAEKKPEELTPAEKLALEEKSKAQDEAAQKELIELDKIIKEKGSQALITDPTLAKRMLKVFSKRKGKGKEAKSLSPFAQVSESEIEAMILLRSQGTPAQDLLIKYPKIVTFIVRFFKSEEAFIGLIKIASQDKKLKLYAGTVVFLILFSFLLNMMGNRKSPFWKRFLRKIFLTCFITSLQFVAIYLFFGNELQPTIDIAKQVFLN
jgi:hypothetical protein